MSEYIHTAYKKAARIQTVVCGFLFALFSFVYLYIFQRDVLEALHFSLAHGKTHFAPLASAIIITFILILLRWGVNCLLGLKGNVRAFSYLPSCLILGVLTDIGKNIYTEDYHTPWGWLLPIILLIYSLLVFWLRRLLRNRLNKESNPVSLMNYNLLILILLCLMTVLIGNTNRKFHHELEAERYLREHRYTEVLKVGEKSLEATRTLTVLRSIAMSRAGLLGEKLFAYPQYYRSDGLFFANDSMQTLRYTNDSIYYLLGVRPYTGEDRMEFLRNICYRGTGKYTALDYYLSALLLEKQIDTFGKALVDFYETEDTLSRYYKEALLMYRESHPDCPFLITDSILIKRYDEYHERKTDFASSVMERNGMRREFGDTYWWYFDYQE